MSSPIESARSKLRWAHEHLNRFNGEIGRWRVELATKDDTVSVALQRDLEAGEYAYIGIVTELPNVPQRFPLIIGDIVHNLRGALDHITWVMADMNEPNRVNDTQTQFPIIGDASQWMHHPVTRWTHYVSDTDKFVLEKLQPYNTSDPADDHPLIWLEAMSNRDKHRELHAVAAAPEGLIMRFAAKRDCIIKNAASISGPLVVGAPCFWFQAIPTGPNPDVEVYPDFVPTIGIAEPEQSGLAVYVLPNLIRAVARIVRACEAVLLRRQ